MNNNSFLEFILKDISAKKTLISTMPVKTKTNKKKLNETLENMEEKYSEYKDSVKNYLLAKCRSFAIKEEDNSENVKKLKEKVENLGNVKFLLNPSNTYFEKMGFDNLMYQISNYYVFNFNSLNDIINGFLDKFELVGIKLTAADFDITCYVHQYMSSYLDVRYNNTKGYDKVSEIFEEIYWVNPQIVEHIELNFRKLIYKNEKKFNAYINKVQKEVMEENNIKTYSECLEKLEETYIELNNENKENIVDIISMCKDGSIDINQFLEGNKIKQNAYDSLIVDTTLTEDENSMSKIVRALEKMILNVEEYKSYVEFSPLFDNFKNEYEKLIPNSDSKKEEYKGLKNIEVLIKNKEAELEKINKKIFGTKKVLFDFNNEKQLKNLKMQSIQIAKELYELQKEYDKEYFNDKVIPILNKTLTVSDVLHLYYSFDYFKKMAIKKVYNITDYNEIIKYSDNFDMFAMDPTNIIVDGLTIFDSVDIPKIISNKYRLNNIKVSEDDLADHNLELIIDKIKLIIREDVIKHSKTDAQKIWFMVQVEKFLAKESKEK